MIGSFYHQQLANTKTYFTQKIRGNATGNDSKRLAKQITSTLFKIAFISDPLLWPAIQAGCEQLTGWISFMKPGNTGE